MELYKDYLKSGLEAYFDIEEDIAIGKDSFDLMATFNQRNAKYMLFKNVEIYSFTANEYLFLKKFDRPLELSDLNWLKDFLDENIRDIVTYDEEHMSSVVTFILEAPMPLEEIAKKLTKFKYYKSFSFGLRGWVNAKVILIDPVLNDGITNKLAKGDLKKFVMN
jgi:hypothetical protein